MKLDYDMRTKNFPDAVYNSEKMKNMEESQQKRTEEGNKVKPEPLKGSYADYRLDVLREARKKFNVDNHGLYKAGGILNHLLYNLNSTKNSAKTRKR